MSRWQLGSGGESSAVQRGPVFIVGAARSGTTLLRLILNAHSELAVCGELHFYDQISRFRRRAPILEDEQDLRLLRRWVERTVAFRLLVSGSAILEGAIDRLRRQVPCYFNKFHQYLLQSYADVSGEGNERLGEKTPANVRYMSEIRRNFPNARFIHLVRDPRAVAASSIDVAGNSDDVLIHSLTWRCDIYCAREFLSSSRRFITEVRYEDLVLKPVREIRRLTDFLGLSFEKSILEFYSEAEEEVQLEKEPWKKGADEPIYQSSLDEWKDRLSAEQIRIVELVAGQFLGKYDYRPVRHSEAAEGSILRGLAVAGSKYVSAKLESRSVLPEQEASGRAIDTDTSRLAGVLVRSLVGGPDSI